MTAPRIVDPAGVLGQALAGASPDLMRHLLATVINALLSVEADAVCGAEWGQASPDRANQRNGYRHRDLDTRVGTIVALGVYALAENRARNRPQFALVGGVLPLSLSGVWADFKDGVAAPPNVNGRVRKRGSNPGCRLG